MYWVFDVTTVSRNEHSKAMADSNFRIELVLQPRVVEQY